jgi:hypothetical protein
LPRRKIRQGKAINRLEDQTALRPRRILETITINDKLTPSRPCAGRPRERVTIDRFRCSPFMPESPENQAYANQQLKVNDCDDSAKQKGSGLCTRGTTVLWMPIGVVPFFKIKSQHKNTVSRLFLLKQQGGL